MSILNENQIRRPHSGEMEATTVSAAPASVFDVILLRQLTASLSTWLSEVFDDALSELPPALGTLLRTQKDQIALVVGLTMHSQSLTTHHATAFEVLSGVHRVSSVKQWQTLSLLAAVGAPWLRSFLQVRAALWRASRDLGASPSEPPPPAPPLLSGPSIPLVQVAGFLARSVAAQVSHTCWRALSALLGGAPTPERVRDAWPALLLGSWETADGVLLLLYAMGASRYSSVELALSGSRLAQGAQPRAIPHASWGMRGLRVGVIAAILLLQILQWSRQQRVASGRSGPSVEHIRRRPRGPIPPPPVPLRLEMDEEPIGRVSGTEILGITPGTVSKAPPKACPLTRRPWEEPCATPAGIVYERWAIEAYVDRHRACPVSGAPCLPTQLVRLFKPSD
jgi:hypothetical protein